MDFFIKFDKVFWEYLKNDFFEMKEQCPHWSNTDIIEVLKDTYIEALDDRMDLLKEYMAERG